MAPGVPLFWPDKSILVRWIGVWHLAGGLSPHAWQDAGDNAEGRKGQGQVILVSHKYALTYQAASHRWPSF